MGCDGGTIPKRDELVRTKKKPEQKDKQSELSFKWGHCSISQEPLEPPIVACQLGRLYSKVSVIEKLIDKSLSESCSHIKSIKDVKELQLTENKSYKDAAKNGDTYIENVARYICPVIGLEMNGKYKFIYLWSCGCVFSEKALKAVHMTVCHKCQQPFTEDDIIVLNGTNEEVESLRNKMEVRKNKLKGEKKLKKSTKVIDTTEQIEVNSEEPKPGPSHVANGNAKNRTSKTNGTTSKLHLKRPNASALQDPDFKKTKITYSVAKDPKATEVFKSIFTSHKSAEKQTKAHWITYNPFYN